MSIRMKWEPVNKTPLDYIENKIINYLGKSGEVTLLENGTLLFVTNEDDAVSTARKVMEEAKFFTDFKTVKMNDGGYLVALHSAVAVYVGEEEYQKIKDIIKSRINDLKFPSEELIVPKDNSEDMFLVGIYGRGKLQRDIYDFNFHKRIEV